MNLQSKLNELYSKGYTRITSNEYNLTKLMNELDNILDLNTYSYGLNEHRLGYDYIEVIKLDN